MIDMLKQTSKPKKPHIRKPLKHQISHYFRDDLPLLPFNPFSQQLTPWNGGSKLQASINLLAKQNSKFISKHHSIDHQATVQNIVSPDPSDYPNLVFAPSYHKSTSHSNSYTCPRIQVPNQSSKAHQQQKDECKRYLFNKKQANMNKNVKKIASLTIEWDEEIVYNPEKKHFEEQKMKRKILREFSHTRNQNRHQLSKKEPNSPQKLIKFQFRNNKIHSKEVSVFEFKKKELSLDMNRNHSKNQKDLHENPHLQGLIHNNEQKAENEIKINTLNFNPQSSRVSLGLDVERGIQTKKAFRSDKWNFRTSLKGRLSVPQAKIGLEKESQKQRPQKQEAKQKKEKQGLNRITLQFHENIKEDKFMSLEALSRTSPHFFRKDAY